MFPKTPGDPVKAAFLQSGCLGLFKVVSSPGGAPIYCPNGSKRPEHPGLQAAASSTHRACISPGRGSLSPEYPRAPPSSAGLPSKAQRTRSSAFQPSGEVFLKPKFQRERALDPCASKQFLGYLGKFFCLLSRTSSHSGSI